MYLLAKFQLHILITYRVTVLQSSNNRTIDLYSEYRGNKISGAYKNGCNLQTNWSTELLFHHCTHREQGNGLLGKVFLYLSFFTAFKGKIQEEKSIAYDRFDVM